MSLVFFHRSKKKERKQCREWLNTLMHGSPVLETYWSWTIRNQARALFRGGRGDRFAVLERCATQDNPNGCITNSTQGHQIQRRTTILRCVGNVSQVFSYKNNPLGRLLGPAMDWRKLGKTTTFNTNDTFCSFNYSLSNMLANVVSHLGYMYIAKKTAAQ